MTYLEKPKTKSWFVLQVVWLSGQPRHPPNTWISLTGWFRLGLVTYQQVEQYNIRISLWTFCDPWGAPCANCSGQLSSRELNFYIWCQVAHVFGENWMQIITCTSHTGLPKRNIETINRVSNIFMASRPYWINSCAVDDPRFAFFLPSCHGPGRSPVPRPGRTPPRWKRTKKHSLRQGLCRPIVWHMTIYIYVFIYLSMYIYIYMQYCMFCDIFLSVRQ